MVFADKEYRQTKIILVIGLIIALWVIINMPSKWEAGWKYLALIAVTLLGYIYFKQIIK